MSLSERIAEQKAAISRLFTLTTQVCKSKRKTSTLADVALKVGNLNLSQLTASVRAVTDTHVAKTGAAHGETAAQIGVQSLTAFNASLNTLLPEGVVPVSRYGSSGYLPPGVSGSFESGTTAVAYRASGGFVEDDGTLVYLRNGTNGSTKGVYYAYMRDAALYSDRQSIKTNRRYQPSYFPAGYTASDIIATSSTVLIGRLQNANGVAGDFFMSLTNGTYDDRYHTGGILTAAQYAALGNGIGEAFVIGDTVYFFGVTYTAAGNTAIEFNVYTVPVATLAGLNGGNVTLTKVTGITTKGFNGITYTKDAIHLCDIGSSNNAALNPMVLWSGSFTSLNLFYYQPPTLVSAANAAGLIRTKMWATCRYASANNAIVATWAVSWTYDPVTKTATLDSGYDTQSTVVDTSTMYAGPVFAASSLDALMSASQQRSNYVFDESGNVFRIMIRNTIDTVITEHGKVTGWTNKFDALKATSARTTMVRSVVQNPQFGSALGSNLVTPMLLGPNKLILMSDGQGDASFRKAFAQTLLEGSPNYTYKSIYLSDLVGYRPSTFRRYLMDDGISEVPFTGTVNEVDGSNVSLTGLRFVSRSIKLSGAERLNFDLTQTGTVTVTETVMQSICSAYQAAAEAALNKTSLNQYIELIIPRNGCPPFVVYAFCSTDRNIYFSIAKVNVTYDASGNISAVTLANGIGPMLNTTIGIGLTVGPQAANLRLGGNVAIYATATSWLVGITSCANANGTGTNALMSFMFRVEKATGNFVTDAAYKYRGFNNYGQSRNFFAHPQLGFGVCYATYGAAGYGDDAAKLIHQRLATTDSEFDALTGATVAPQSAWTVLAAQDVPEGYSVYFSEETPLVLNGKYFAMPVTSVDLKTVTSDPANKTFYIYARLVGNVASYKVELAASAESNINMYLGQLTTDSQGITSINVEKVTRLGNARLSATSVGSAIPVSVGNPSSAKPLEWS